MQCVYSLLDCRLYSMSQDESIIQGLDCINYIAKIKQISFWHY